MATINASSKFTDLTQDSEKFRYIQLFCQSVQQTVNGNLDFKKNLRVKFKSVVFTTADTNVEVTHGLGFIPNGYIVIGLNNNMIIYDGSTPSTTQTITLKSDNDGTAQIMFF